MTDENPNKLKLKNKHFCIAEADTGASNHYWRVKDQHILHEIRKDAGLSVQLPNIQIIHSTTNAQLPLPQKL